MLKGPDAKLAGKRVIWVDAARLRKIGIGSSGVRDNQPCYFCLCCWPDQSERNFTNNPMGGVTPCEGMAAERQVDHFSFPANCYIPLGLFLSGCWQTSLS